MLQLYYRLMFLVGPLARGLLGVWTAIAGTPRPRVLLYDAVAQKVLLIKTTVGGKQWSLPGGGAKRGEALESAAVRELWEEVGVTIPVAALTESVNVERRVATQPPTRIFFAQYDSKRPLHVSTLEVTSVKWFTVKDQPMDIRPDVARAVSRLLESGKIGKM